MKKTFVIGLFIFSTVMGQQVVSAVRASSDPVLDGDVINDSAWSEATAITLFTQKTPDEGQAVSEATVVKVMYSDTYFFVALIAYDLSLIHI